MGAQRRRRQIRAVGGEHQLLGFGLGPGIVGLKVGGIGDGFVNPLHVLAVEDDARRAGVNQPVDAVSTAGGDDVDGADNVGPVVILIIPPDPGFGGDMKDQIAARRRLRYRPGIGQIPLYLFDPEGIQFRVEVAR